MKVKYLILALSHRSQKGLNYVMSEISTKKTTFFSQGGGLDVSYPLVFLESNVFLNATLREIIQ